MLRIGFGQVEITPRPGLRMVGMPGSPRGDGVVWPLRGRVMLADDGRRRVAVVCLDLLSLLPEDVAALRERLTGAAGLDPAEILIVCSHTHRAPFTSSDWGEDEGTADVFRDDVFTRITAAMTGAVAALQPVTLSVGLSAVPGWAFNRRPIYARGQVGTHGPARGNGFLRMEGTTDDTVGLLVARGRNGATLGGLVTFACHPTAMAHDPIYSADYPGALTEQLEARHGGLFGFLLGAAADVSTPDPTSHDPESGFGRAHTAAMGGALADAASLAMLAARPVAAESIAVATTRLRIPQRRPTPDQVALARWYLEDAPADVDELDITRRLTGHDYTFNDGVQVGNERHARELLAMSEWQRQRPVSALVEEIELQAVAIGDVAIVAFPVELFAAFGRRLQTSSPFNPTFIATLANGWHGYAPTIEAFARGGYEPRFAYPSRLAPEAGDRMTNEAIALLGRLAPAG
jgi:hypothetical protein